VAGEDWVVAAGGVAGGVVTAGGSAPGLADGLRFAALAAGAGLAT
jgi:hypothetical protein